MIESLAPFRDSFEKGLEAYRENLPKTNLYQPIDYILSLGGKRIRPLLVLLAGKAYKGSDESLLPAAIAIEVFHNFSLVHDDIMDEAPLRRGKPTVHAKWDDNAAILSGDTMLIEAYKLLAKSSREKLPEIIDLFNTTSVEVCEGQQSDMDFETRENVSPEEYIQMIKHKTAVLLGCALKMGGILGGASEEDQQNLYDFGVKAGIGFQIQDDYLDAFGDPETFGKQVGGDIISNKKTFLTIAALKGAKGSTKSELEGIFFHERIQDPKQKVARVLEIYKELGIDRLSRDESDAYFQSAHDLLKKLDIDDAARRGFFAFLEALQVRKS